MVPPRLNVPVSLRPLEKGRYRLLAEKRSSESFEDTKTI
jgi:hypothetical protein